MMRMADAGGKQTYARTVPWVPDTEAENENENALNQQKMSDRIKDKWAKSSGSPHRLVTIFSHRYQEPHLGGDDPLGELLSLNLQAFQLGHTPRENIETLSMFSSIDIYSDLPIEAMDSDMVLSMLDELRRASGSRHENAKKKLAEFANSISLSDSLPRSVDESLTWGELYDNAEAFIRDHESYFAEVTNNPEEEEQLKVEYLKIFLRHRLDSVGQ